MNSEKIPKANGADARIVQTVRKLKEVNNIEQEKKEERKNSRGVSSKKRKNIKHSTMDPIPEKKLSTNLNINNNNKNLSRPVTGKLHINESISKFAIDGSLKQGNFQNEKKQVFNYDNLKRYNKRGKSEYQKNILSPANLEKYKEEFILFLQKDKEINKLIEYTNVVKNDDYEIFARNNFFCKPYFLFALEMLILEDFQEANTLKVFRKNPNVLPLKVVKENYFRDEVKKYLNVIYSEMEYQKESDRLFNDLDSYIKRINEFKI